MAQKMTWLFEIVWSNYLSEKTIILILNIVYLFLFVCLCMRVCKIDNICEKFNSKSFEYKRTPFFSFFDQLFRSDNISLDFLQSKTILLRVEDNCIGQDLFFFQD